MSRARNGRVSHIQHRWRGWTGWFDGLTTSGPSPRDASTPLRSAQHDNTSHSPPRALPAHGLDCHPAVSPSPPTPLPEGEGSRACVDRVDRIDGGGPQTPHFSDYPQGKGPAWRGWTGWFDGLTTSGPSPRDASTPLRSAQHDNTSHSHAPPIHPHPRIKCGAGSHLPPSRGKGPGATPWIPGGAGLTGAARRRRTFQTILRARALRAWGGVDWSGTQGPL